MDETLRDAWGYAVRIRQQVTFAGKEGNGNITFNLGRVCEYDPVKDRYLIQRTHRSKGGDVDETPRMVWVSRWKVAVLPTPPRARKAEGGHG